MANRQRMAELKQKKSDLGKDRDEIEVLIGSDYYANLLMGKKYCRRMDW